MNNFLPKQKSIYISGVILMLWRVKFNKWLGSIVSVVAAWLFLYIVYIQLIEGEYTDRHPWLSAQFYTDT